MSTTSYTFDLTHSAVGFSVRHLMISKVKGYLRSWTGTLELDLADLAKSKVDVTIDATSIDTQQEQRDAHLKSADFFETEKFPSLTFKSTAVKVVDDTTLEVTGDLTIRDVTRPVVLEVENLGQVADSYFGTRAGFSAKTHMPWRRAAWSWATRSTSRSRSRRSRPRSPPPPSAPRQPTFRPEERGSSPGAGGYCARICASASPKRSRLKSIASA
jgi:polyisoprenoid-binding protein YceI